MTRYLIYDVFADAPLAGNPLAVVPDASALPEAALQPLAREFNLSETVFMFPAEAPGATARLRIFTPTMEVPFAGHPVIGAAVALAEAGRGPEMLLELGVGPLPCRAGGGRASVVTERPLEILAEPEPALVARALGLPARAIRTDRHAPAIASVGLPFTLTELSGPEALAACAPDTAAFQEGTARHPGALDFAQYAYVREGSDVQARMFAPLDLIPEDPATGSAACALAAFLAAREGGAARLEIRQGETMGRPSRISVTAEGGRVTLSGAARRVMEGRLLL